MIPKLFLFLVQIIYVHGVVVTFFSDFSCTQKLSGNNTIVAFSDTYTPFSSHTESGLRTGFDVRDNFLLATTCTNSSVTITGFIGTCSATTTPEVLASDKTLRVPSGTCVSHRNALVQCSGCGGGYYLDVYLKIIDPSCGSPTPGCTGQLQSSSLGCPPGTKVNGKSCHSCEPGFFFLLGEDQRNVILAQRDIFLALMALHFVNYVLQVLYLLLVQVLV